jgi:hypothetical protein
VCDSLIINAKELCIDKQMAALNRFSIFRGD